MRHSLKIIIKCCYDLSNKEQCKEFKKLSKQYFCNLNMRSCFLILNFQIQNESLVFWWWNSLEKVDRLPSWLWRWSCLQPVFFHAPFSNGWPALWKYWIRQHLGNGRLIRSKVPNTPEERIRGEKAEDLDWHISLATTS